MCSAYLSPFLLPVRPSGTFEKTPLVGKLLLHSRGQQEVRAENRRCTRRSDGRHRQGSCHNPGSASGVHEDRSVLSHCFLIQCVIRCCSCSPATTHALGGESTYLSATSVSATDSPPDAGLKCLNYSSLQIKRCKSSGEGESIFTFPPSDQNWRGMTMTSQKRMMASD